MKRIFKYGYPRDFDVWVKNQLFISEREDLQGYSNQMLYICKKNYFK